MISHLFSAFSLFILPNSLFPHHFFCSLILGVVGSRRPRLRANRARRSRRRGPVVRSEGGRRAGAQGRRQGEVQGEVSPLSLLQHRRVYTLLCRSQRAQPSYLTHLAFPLTSLPRTGRRRKASTTASWPKSSSHSYTSLVTWVTVQFCSTSLTSLSIRLFSLRPSSPACRCRAWCAAVPWSPFPPDGSGDGQDREAAGR